MKKIILMLLMLVSFTLAQDKKVLTEKEINNKAQSILNELKELKANAYDYDGWITYYTKKKTEANKQIISKSLELRDLEKQLDSLKEDKK